MDNPISHRQVSSFVSSVTLKSDVRTLDIKARKYRRTFVHAPLELELLVEARAYSWVQDLSARRLRVGSFLKKISEPYTDIYIQYVRYTIYTFWTLPNKKTKKKKDIYLYWLETT